MSEFSKGSQPSDLTPRERQVVSLVTQGFHTDEIASLMSTDVHTVRRILKAILTKTGLKDSAEIPLYAQRRQL